ncbi:MAG: hypothetical protein UDQ58_07015 [Desulfovibrio sp.]|nr:hypothetical protein [Desulfovibrio sp.]MEE0406314.1 hypothetical protein [Desulfovibrio sp.]
MTGTTGDLPEHSVSLLQILFIFSSYDRTQEDNHHTASFSQGRIAESKQQEDLTGEAPFQRN